MRLELSTRRPAAAAAVLAVAMLVSACAAAQAPAWTYAPPTPSPTGGASASAPASAGASAAPSAEGSAATSAAPSGGSAAPSAGGSAAPSGGSGGGAGTTLDLVALNIAFDKAELSAPANAPFTIHFDNQDASTQHNVAIKDGSGNDVFKPDLLTGPATVDYSVTPLPAGTYTFYCVVHANMTGTLTVGP